MQDWKTFDDPRFELTFRYPDPTPEGREVRRIEGETDGGGLRVHHLTAERELYVEVVRFPPLAAEDEYERHKRYLEQRFGAEALGELLPATLADRPAQSYAFSWPEGQRVAVVLRTDSWTYRVIYNSASPLNERVLATFELKA